MSIVDKKRKDNEEIGKKNFESRIEEEDTRLQSGIDADGEEGDEIDDRFFVEMAGLSDSE